jgi:hypothetical protein
LGAFYLTLLLLIILATEVVYNRRTIWARSAGLIYFITGMWYLADFVYNDPRTFFERFSDEQINVAFAQVCGFLLTFRFLVEYLAQYAVLGATASTAPSVTSREQRGRQEAGLFWVLASTWALITLIGWYRVGSDVWNIILPPLSQNPQYFWGRGAVGQGADFLVSAGEYSHLAVCGMLGVLAVTAVRPNIRVWAVAFFVISMPHYLFQPARHRMLAIIIPSVLAYLLTGRASLLRKGIFAGVAFVMLSSWFLFVIDVRSGQRTWADVSASDLAAGETDVNAKHYGLEMMSELCYVGQLMDSGRYNPDFGEEYFSQAVAFIPRWVWPDKPFIVIDYSIARGFYDAKTGFVSTNITPGMIGQGVINCGPVFGPVVAAVLAAIWAGILSRLWAQRVRPERSALFLLGMALTINMGRGISLLALFPFVFAYVGVRTYEVLRPPTVATPRPAENRLAPGAA